VNHILIAEDEERIASFLEKGLQANGFETSVADDGAVALDLARSGRFDLVILDLGLPTLDGFTVLHALRNAGIRLPVVILTARDEPSQTVAGLESGADDYMTKPFKFQELLARVRIRLRGNGADEPAVLRVGDLALDLQTRRAEVAGENVDLTAREFELAEVFFRHPDQVLTRDQLVDHVWGYDVDPGSNIVDVYVGYLRRKLGPDAIECIRGLGYRFHRLPRRAHGV
jgi:two-component system copper resistance phosphate regulon response regulator CusR